MSGGECVKEVRGRGGRRKEEELFGSLTILLASLCHGAELILPSLTDHMHTRRHARAQGRRLEKLLITIVYRDGWSHSSTGAHRLVKSSQIRSVQCELTWSFWHCDSVFWLARSKNMVGWCNSHNGRTKGASLILPSFFWHKYEFTTTTKKRAACLCLNFCLV